MFHIQAYRERGTYGGIVQPERLYSFEWHVSDSDGDHYYALPYATSLEEAKRQVAERSGVPADDIPIKVV